MAKVILVEWETGSPCPSSVNKSHPTTCIDSGKNSLEKMGSPFIIPNNFFFPFSPAFRLRRLSKSCFF
jgi:hypothetical protein